MYNFIINNLVSFFGTHRFDTTQNFFGCKNVTLTYRIVNQTTICFIRCCQIFFKTNLKILVKRSYMSPDPSVPHYHLFG